MSAHEQAQPSMMTFIGRSHLKPTIAPVNYPYTNGAFRESLLSTLYRDALPIIPDANTLRGDIA